MDEPKLGEQYGKYELIEHLDKNRKGDEGEAYIWKAVKVDGNPEEIVVLRILKQHENMDMEDLQQQFNLEVQNHRSLSGGRHIISLLDWDWNHGTPYLVTPYILGKSLRDAMKRGISSNDCFIYINQIFEALIYIHDQGLIYRDMKPENLLLDDDGIVVIDFGLAIGVEDTIPKSKGDWGTDPYTPQEQWDKNPRQASDQYALAVTICKLVTGKDPEKGGKEDLQAKFPKTAEVCVRAWHNDDSMRFPSMKDFHSAFNQAALFDHLKDEQIPEKFQHDIVNDHDVGQIQTEVTLSQQDEFLQQFCPGARLKEFDFRKVQEYAKLQPDSDQLRQDAKLQLDSDQPSLEAIQYLCRCLGLASSQYIPRFAAVLAFHSAPSRHLPSAVVRVTTRGLSSEEPYLRENIGGSLSEQAERTIKWLTTNLNTVSENIGAGERIDRCEIPERALRELVVNALLHRKYNQKVGESVQVTITPQQVIITNPGQLYSEIEYLKSPFFYQRSHPQNPALLLLLEAQRWAEGRGRGFLIVREEFEKYKLPLPKISKLDNGSVEVVIQRPDLNTISHQLVPPQRSFLHLFWRKEIFWRLSLFLLTLLIIGDIGLRLFNNVPAAANLLTVTTLLDNVPGSLRQEIALAQNMNGATITFTSLRGTVKLTQDLDIPTDVNIEAPMAHQITLTPQITLIPQKSTIRIHIPQGKSVSFMNTDFQGNNNEVRTSAFIVNEGALHISNARISGNDGGVVDNLNGTLTFTQSEIDHNQSLANDGGAISNLNGTVTLDSSKVDNNQANYNGGGIYSLNGHIFIENQSSITYNQVLSSLSGSDQGGGGGLTIHGGTVSISDSSIESNISQGNGGGILLIGASAQIYDSSIQYNQTHTTQAGGIAVLSNPENNYSSFLVLADNTLVQYNSNLNSKSSTDFAVNIQGKVVGEDAANTSISSEPGAPRPATDPTTFKQFLGYLTLKNFRTYCQSQQNSQKQPFTDARPSSDGQTITCTSDGGETLVLSSQNRKVNQVCAMLYPGAKLTLARLFRYNDSTTWQCFQDEHLLSAITKPISPTNKVPLDSYCAGMGASAELVPEPNQSANAYDWDCKQGTVRLSITMDLACQSVTGNPLALGELVDHSDPSSWECWGPNGANN